MYCIWSIDDIGRSLKIPFIFEDIVVGFTLVVWLKLMFTLFFMCVHTQLFCAIATVSEVRVFAFFYSPSFFLCSLFRRHFYAIGLISNVSSTIFYVLCTT